MIKLSAKAEYAARAVLHLSALSSSGQSCTLDDISSAQKIPRNLLIQIMAALSKAGIVLSRRGVKGGYTLRKLPKDIPLIDVIEQMDGSIADFHCGREFPNCLGEDVCRFRHVWEGLGREFSEKLGKIRFADLLPASTREKPGAGAALVVIALYQIISRYLEISARSFS